MSGRRVILFGGTTEGRELARFLAAGGVSALVLVATEYGRDRLDPLPGLEVRAGRLDAGEMAALLRTERPELVIDATHPYARAVGENIAAACERVGVERLRVLRPSGGGDGVRAVANMDEAADFLAATGTRALLSVGSKELAAFTRVPDFRDRLCARVLPDPAVVAHCAALGFAGPNLIAMQGPFSAELNAAMLRAWRADCLVTKDSGAAGGLPEKLEAARHTGAEVLLIGRPAAEEGLSLEEALDRLADRLGVERCKEMEAAAEEGGYFPLFHPLGGRLAVLVGGGAVSERRAEVLRGFGVRVRVVSPSLTPRLQELAGRGEIDWRRGDYRPEDLDGAALAVAATDRREVNRQIGRDAKARGIPVSVADRRGECGVLFPAIARRGGLTAGIVDQAGDHAAVRRAARVFRERLCEDEDGSHRDEGQRPGAGAGADGAGGDRGV